MASVQMNWGVPASTTDARTTDDADSRRGWVRLLDIGLLVAIGLLTLARHVWVAQVVQLALLMVVPGRLLLRALRVPGMAIARFPVYVPAASLAVLSGAGLVVDLVGPPLGVSHPLRTGPLLFGVEVTCVLLWVASIGATVATDVPRRPLAMRVRHLWPLVLPLAAAAGALLLTNGHGPAVAIAAVSATVLALSVCAALAHRLSEAHLAVALYGIALAAIWSFTLRSHFLYGFDITSEYHVLTSVLSAGVWHPAHRFDAYGAMLSLTILPSTLVGLAGFTPLVVLKVVYPVLFALFPVALFALARRFVVAGWAFVAAGFVAAQSYFFEQLPGIARQEIALVLFVALMAAILDTDTPVRRRVALVVVLGLGLVVFHYGTTYLTAAILGLTVVLQLVVSTARPGSRFAPATVCAFVVVAAGASLWYGPITHSNQNVGSFTENLQQRGFAFLPNAAPGENPFVSYLSGNAPRRIDADQYERLVARDYAKTRPYVHPLAVARLPRYHLHNASVPSSKVTAPAVADLRYMETAIAQLVNLLAILGAIGLALRRGSPPLFRRLGILTVSTLVVLAAIRLSGTAANAYNQERAFLQTLVLLVVCMIWLVELLARRLSRTRPVVGIVAALFLLLVFFNTSGLRDLVAGGGPPVNLASSGEDFERFYITAPELAAARWIAGAPRGALIYADRYGQLRILAATGRSQGLLLAITPPTLDRHAWIYASRTNVLAGRTRGQINNEYSIYGWPQLVPDRFNLVYSNGSAEAYYR